MTSNDTIDNIMDPQIPEEKQAQEVVEQEIITQDKQKISIHVGHEKVIYVLIILVLASFGVAGGLFLFSRVQLGNSPIDAKITGDPVQFNMGDSPQQQQAVQGAQTPQEGPQQTVGVANVSPAVKPTPTKIPTSVPTNSPTQANTPIPTQSSPEPTQASPTAEPTDTSPSPSASPSATITQ